MKKDINFDFCVKLFYTPIFVFALSGCGNPMNSKTSYPQTPQQSQANSSSTKASGGFPPNGNPINGRPQLTDQELDQLIDIVQRPDGNKDLGIVDESVAEIAPYSSPLPPNRVAPGQTKAPTGKATGILTVPAGIGTSEEPAPTIIGPNGYAVAVNDEPAPLKNSEGTTPLPEQSTATTNGDSRDGNRSVKDQAINLPSNGLLKNSTDLTEALKKNGDETRIGLSPRTVNTNRIFGTDDLVNFIQFLGGYYSSVFKGRKLMVADLSTKSGGPVCCARDSKGRIKHDKSGRPVLSHASHQNGVDADFGYAHDQIDTFFSVNDPKQQQSHTTVVKQFEIFKAAIKSNIVDFILIAPSLKKKFCIEAYKSGDLSSGNSIEGNEVLKVLSRLVPDKGHIDHYHVRIKCDPKTQPNCKAQTKILNGHGCTLKDRT